MLLSVSHPQGSEMAALRDDLEKAEELARKLDTNSKSMADSATVVNAARQEVRGFTIEVLVMHVGYGS